MLQIIYQKKEKKKKSGEHYGNEHIIYEIKKKIQF